MKAPDIKHPGAWTGDKCGPKTADGSARKAPETDYGKRHDDQVGHAHHGLANNPIGEGWSHPGSGKRLGK